MGKYQNGKYCRGKNDGELQWLEDGTGLVFSVAFGSIVLFFVGIFKVFTGLLSLAAGRDLD